MFNFNTILACAGILLAAVACGQTETKSASPEKTEEKTVRKLDKIGVQLYTVRGEMERDFEGTLRKIANLGYDEVEFAGLFDNDPKDVKSLLDELGLDPVASHVNWKKFKENPDAMIAETVALGSRYMILPYLPEEERQTLDQWRDWIARLNEAGAKAHEQGVVVAYHNHEFEFEEIDGVKPFDLIMAEIDRRYVKLEMDLFWVTLAGEDPAVYFGQYEGGFPLSHVKDMTPEKQMVDVGSGAIDFASIFATAEDAGMKHFIVEHDNPEDPMQSIENSITYLRSLEY